LLNNLSKEIPKEKIMQILSELSLSHKVRPSELSITDWISLIKKL
ncbi:MAG: dimethyladenosine transferase, partial [Deltaproteobacteria bacterium]